jgi:formimidoylglutamate deiminase
MPQPNTTFLAPHIWLNGAWAQDVVLTVDATACWQSIETHADAAAKLAAQRLGGTVLPSLVNAHSHAFQRAFAGMAETRTGGHDHFWSWRDRMYAVANRITPTQLQAIAAQLYLEMLQGGYTQVCEFHYLHHDIGGKPYADPYAMSWALVKAAQQVGIGLTLLPVLYERAGFTAPTLRADQARFATTPASVAQLARHFNDAGLEHVNAGVAIHSLRAASSESIRALYRSLADENIPIHIHVSEQMAEVNECLAVTGARPVQWLAQQGLLDPRWHLVHATHTTAAEIEAVAQHRANVVICPTTEANLGDGFTDVSAWLNTGIGFTIGSDSHVSRNWREELRWLEYGQRLHLQARNVCAAPSLGQPSTAQRLFQAVHAGGASAAGRAATGFIVGARADFVVLDSAAPALLGVPLANTLDALVFASDHSAIAQIYVAGRCVVERGAHTQQAQIAHNYSQTMKSLWAN